ncbi:MAG: glycosyltransferase family 9 protein [Pseudomonadota bacterium]
MNITLVRTIDRRVGVPATALLSLALKLFPSPAPPSAGAPIRNALFIELSELGSPILAYPAMMRLLEAHPGCNLHFLVFEHNRYSVDRLGLFPPDRVFTLSTESAWALFRSTLSAIRGIRRAGMDAVFDLELFSRFSALLAGMSGAPIRVGYDRHHMEGLYRGHLFTHPVLYNPHQHVTKNFLALAAAPEHAGEHPLVKEAFPGPFPRPDYHPDHQARTRVLERLEDRCPAATAAKRLVLLNPYAGEYLPMRAWPVERYAELGRRILANHDAAIAVIGLPGAREAAEAVVQGLDLARAANLAGETDIEELFGLLAAADLLVTSDAGPAHLATLTNTPAVVLFGPETPDLYAPLHEKTRCITAHLACSPCLSAYNHRTTTCTAPRCMTAISVEEVYAAAEKMLGSPGR